MKPFDSGQVLVAKRRWLRRLLRLGLAGAAFTLLPASGPRAMGSLPRLPPGRSIYKLSGDVSVDGRPATLDTRIHAGAHIRTGDSSRIIFVVGSDAFLLRSNSELQLEGDGFLVRGLRMLSGRLLSVFGKSQSRRQLTTATATIGIRGTGVYLESEPERSYVCTCYGHTRIVARGNPSQIREVRTRHHDSPFFILADGAQLIHPAPVINHTDAELELIEDLVGRVPPFVENDLFGGPDGGGNGGGY